MSARSWVDVTWYGPTCSSLCLAAYLLKGSDSATSMATLGVGIVIFVGLQWLRKLKLRVPQTVLLALVIFLAAYGISAPFLAGYECGQIHFHAGTR